jgi:glycine/D-amino acid oxidase-like deaminating enzyme
MVAQSPWIHQLNRSRPISVLDQPKQTDLVIVGAGIAGVITAYFALKHTKSRVMLIEAGKVAHGATGHNAGQVVSYFERQVSGLVEEFGLELTAQAQRAIDSAWQLVETIFLETGITTPFAKFTGYAGCQDLDEILLHLENSLYCRVSGLPIEPLYVAQESPVVQQIPQKYEGLFLTMPHSRILESLETDDLAYIAMITAPKGCMNSALFCEDVLSYMMATYSDRFELVEHSPVSVVHLFEDRVELKVLDHTVRANNVVLCTNGYENFTIQNHAGQEIDAQFHQLVTGRIGYMAAYLEHTKLPPTAISYLPVRASTGEDTFDEHPYFYLTRREFELGEQKNLSLVCVGGPETILNDESPYSTEHPYPEEAQASIDAFLHRTYLPAPAGEIHYHYQWHGLMGYTPNGVRRIGPDQFNSRLLYNLGCNGVGILPSIYGGRKISQFLSGEDLPPSIFDGTAFEAHSTMGQSQFTGTVRSALQGFAV